jgi:hypothetical protein
LTKLRKPGEGRPPAVGAGIDDRQGAAAVAGRMTSALTCIGPRGPVGILEKDVGENDGLEGEGDVVGRNEGLVSGSALDGPGIRGFSPGGRGKGSILKGRLGLLSPSARNIGNTKLPTAIPHRMYSMIRCCCSVGK